MYLQDNLLQQIRKLIPLSLWSLGLTLIAYLTNGRNITIDDADIFFTYAQNLADGNGLIYSVGTPRVEGYTSTMWMLLSAAAFKAGLGEIGIWLISLILFIATHYLGFRIIEYSAHQSFWKQAKVIYCIGVSLSFGYISWMLLPLMDTTLWGFMLMAICFIMMITPKSRNSKIFAGSIFLLITLVRPEAIFLIPLLFFGIFMFNKGWLNKLYFSYFLTFLFAAISLTFIRLLFFGYPFPNTYYAKVSSSIVTNIATGMGYITQFFQSSLLGLIAFVAIMVWLVALTSRRLRFGQANYSPLEGVIRIRPFTTISLVIFSFLTVTVLSGGDHFNLFRIIQPITPLFILIVALLGANLPNFYPNLTKTASSIVIASLLAFSELQAFLNGQSLSSALAMQRSPIAHEFQIAQNGRYWGFALNNIFKDSDNLPNVATVAAGGFARTYEGTIYDLMGLNNAEMAHGSENRNGYRNHAIFDKEIFFNWPVDIVLSAPDSWSMNIALKGLSNDSRFSSNFTYGCLTNLAFPNNGICAYYRNSLVSGLDGLRFRFEEKSQAANDIVGPFLNN